MQRVRWGAGIWMGAMFAAAACSSATTTGGHGAGSSSSGSSGSTSSTGSSGGSGSASGGSSSGASGSGSGSGGSTSGSSSGSTGSGGDASSGPPGAFTLVSPIQGASGQPLMPMLQWNAADSADSYRVEIATSAAFGSADVVNDSVAAPNTSYTVATSLTAGVIYQWRVTAVNSNGSTVAMGAPWRFSSPYVVPGAHGVAVTPDGARLVVASDVNNGPVDVIDLATHAVTKITTGVPSQPMGVAVSPDGKQALATLLTNGNGGINGVAVIDLTGNKVTGTITDPCVATTLSDVAYFPGGTQAALPDLAPSCTAMGLSTFSPATANSFSFVNFMDTNNPTGVAVSPSGAFALVTMQLDSKVYRVTLPSTVTPISVASPSGGVAITPDGSKALVAGSSLFVIDLSNNAVSTIALTNDTPGSDFHNVAITPDGTLAVVAGAASIQVVSLSSSAVVSNYPASGLTSVAVSPDGKNAYVTGQGDGWVRVLQIP